MALARTIAGRSLVQRPGRTLFSILGIALGIVTVVGVFTLDHNTVVGFTLRGADKWTPALEVRPPNDVDDPRTTLEQTPGVASVAAMFQNDASVRVASREGEDEGGGARGVRTTVRLFALDAAGIAEIGAVRLVAGRMLEPDASERQVLVGAALADTLGLSIGDALALARPRRAPRRDCIDGEMIVVEDAPPDVPREETFTIVGILARERLGRRSRGQVVVVDFERGRELYTGSRVEPRYWVRQGADVDIERLRASLGESFSYDLNRSVIVGAAADERAFRNGVRMAGLLALVLGLYVIFHTLSMSLVERVREVGTLHALGATRAQVARIFLTEAVCVSGLAGLLGMTGGIGLARVLSKMGITTLGTGHWFDQFSVPWLEVTALTLLGVGVALLGSIYPLVRARHANTADALRGEAALKQGQFARGFHVFAAILLVLVLPALYFVIVPVIGAAQGALVGAVLLGVGFLALLVVLPLIVPSLLGFLCVRLARPFELLSPLVGRLAGVAMRESPARVAVSSAAIALVAASFVGLKGMTASLVGEIEVWSERAVVDKVWVRDLPNVKFDELRSQLDRYPGIVGVEHGGLRTYVPFLIIGLRSAEVSRWGPLAEGPELRTVFDDGRGMIVSERLSRHLGYEVGDPVYVSTGGGVRELTVLAVSDAYGYFPHPDERMYGVVSNAFMRDAFCIGDEVCTQVAVRLAPGTDPGVVVAAVAERWPDADVNHVTGRGLRVAHLADLRRDFLLFDVILGLTALLAALGVLNGQLLSALERTKELGILKALGTSRTQVAGSVLLESLVVGLLGGLLGTVLGAALTPVIVRALSVLSGLDLPQRTAGVWLVAVPLGALVLTLVAALYPIWRMNRLDAVRAVRTG